MMISINGQSVKLEDNKLSHEEICDLAEMPYYSSVVFTRRSIIPTSGTVTRGKTIEITSGMEIDCVPTTNA